MYVRYVVCMHHMKDRQTTIHKEYTDRQIDIDRQTDISTKRAHTTQTVRWNGPYVSKGDAGNLTPYRLPGCPAYHEYPLVPVFCPATFSGARQ